MSIENVNSNIDIPEFNVDIKSSKTKNDGFISKIIDCISDFEIMDFEEDFSNETNLLEITGTKSSEETKSKLNGFESWLYDTNKFMDEEIFPILENIGDTFINTIERTGATIAVGGLSLIEGLGQFGESLVDLITLAGTGVASIGTGIYDGIQAIYSNITGNEWESATKEMWNITKGFVAEKYVTNSFDKLYNNTSDGRELKEKAYGYDTIRTIGSGLGYTTGVVAISLLTFGVGGAAVGGASAAGGVAVTAGQTAMVAGAAGMGKGTQDSWSDGAGLGEGLATGTLTGLWEGLQFYLGAKIGGSNLINLDSSKGKILNSLSRIALDGIDSGAEGFMQPLISSIYKDGYTNDLGEYVEFSTSDNFFERYGEIFNDYGSWKNVLTQAAIGSVGSTIGEVSDLTRFLKNNNDTNINVETMNTLKNVSINNDESITRDLMFAIGAYLDKYGGDPEKVIAHLKNGIYENNYNAFSNHNGARSYIKEYDFQQLSSAIDNIAKAYQSNKIQKDVFSQYQYWDREMLSTNFDSIFDKINSSANFNNINQQIDIINRHAANGRFYRLNVNNINDIPQEFWTKINDPSLLEINVNGKIMSYYEAKSINLKQNSFNIKNDLTTKIKQANMRAASGNFCIIDIDSINDLDINDLNLINYQNGIEFRTRDGKILSCNQLRQIFSHSSELKRELILNSMNIDDPILKARNLYMELNKKVHYDQNYFRGDQNVKKAIYDPFTTFDNLNPNNTIICKGWSELYADLLISSGFDPNDVKIVGNLHKWVELDLKNGYILTMDATDGINGQIDISACKTGMATNGFAILNKQYSGTRLQNIYKSENKSQNINFINDQENWIRNIDKSLGYIGENGYLLDEINKSNNLFSNEKLYNKLFGEKQLSKNIDHIFNLELPKNVDGYEAYAFFKNYNRKLLGENSKKITYNTLYLQTDSILEPVNVMRYINDNELKIQLYSQSLGKINLNSIQELQFYIKQLNLIR